MKRDQADDEGDRSGQRQRGQDVGLDLAMPAPARARLPLRPA